MEYLFYYMAPISDKIWEDEGQQNTTNFGDTKSFPVRTEPKHIQPQHLVDHFILPLLSFFS